MFKPSRAALLFAVLLFTSLTMAQQPKTHPEFVVSTKWLADHLSDSKLVIVQVSSPDDYKSGHIPGARVLPGNKFTGPGTELLPDDQLKANLEAIGIGDDSRVIIYTPDWGPMATRLFFTLDYLGFNNAAMLDGGIDKWQDEKRATSTDEPAITKGSLTVHPHPEIVAKLDAVKQWVSTPGEAVLIDARPKRRYRAGHLSGAAPLFWETNLVDPEALVQVLKSPDELRKQYVAAGAAPGKRLVSYCEVGWQASYAYFIARYLGYDAAMYDGSWSEWSKEKQPSVKGDSAR